MTERERETALMIAARRREVAEQESLRQHSERMADISREYFSTVQAINEEYNNAGQR
jgi:hypothetical protein